MSTRPTCRTCGKSPAKNKGLRDNGTRRWHAECSGCHKRRYYVLKEKARIARRDRKKRADGTWKSRRDRHLGKQCECCAFVPEDLIQLHLDHKDGNRANNHPSNFQTLCANCHTLKTKRSGDWRTPSRQQAPYAFDGRQWIANVH